MKIFFFKKSANGWEKVKGISTGSVSIKSISELRKLENKNIKRIIGAELYEEWILEKIL